jgi:hypothetical protein
MKTSGMVCSFYPTLRPHIPWLEQVGVHWLMSFNSKAQVILARVADKYRLDAEAGLSVR